MNSTAVVVIVLVLLVVVVLGVVLARRRRSTQLQEHFGPEYERSVTAADGDRRAAEAKLSEREKRRQEFDVRDLRPEERSRFRDSWNEVQRGFVDDPRQSLHSADLLVAEVMRTRGYPVDDDFDRRADDLSVDHPRVVQHYREARRVRDEHGEVDTEKQRTAITSYRSLIDALLGDDEAHTADTAADRDRDDRDRDDRVRDDRVRDDRAAIDDAGDRRVDDRRVDDRRVDDRRVDDRHLDDRRVDDGLRDDGRADDATGAGRHALRDQERPPTDPNGNQTPRTEERTR